MSGFYESAQWREFKMGHPGGEKSTKWLLSHCNNGGRLLDLCCGFGASSAVAASMGFEVVGLDKAEIAAQALSAYPEIDFRAWSGEALPFDDCYFDAALCECSLSLLDNQSFILSELTRVLNPDGRFLVSDIYDAKAFPCLSGFKTLCGEDRSGDLKEFAVQWLWETGTRFPCSCSADGYFVCVYAKDRYKNAICEV